MRRIKHIFFFLFTLLTLQITICNYSYALPLIDWVRMYPDTDSFRGAGYSLVLDNSGNVFVAGITDSSGYVGYCTIKYSQNGFQQWAARFYGPLQVTYSKSIAIDNQANVYVTGYSNNGSSIFDYCTVKYNSNG